MMTEQELQALIDLLRRVPMTPAEQLWVNALIGRLAAEIKAKAEPAAKIKATEGGA